MPGLFVFGLKFVVSHSCRKGASRMGTRTFCLWDFFGAEQTAEGYKEQRRSHGLKPTSFFLALTARLKVVP